ncbi:MAG: NUDIX hydrolase [bacterium]|nr:NUDIX hydrolase [bacterium]
MTQSFDWSVAIFVRIGGGLVAVRKRRKDGTLGPWHNAGGKREPYELCVEETASRELWEETGIKLPPSAFKVQDHISRSTLKYQKGQRGKQKHFYELYYFVIELQDYDVTTLRTLDPMEQVRFFKFSEYRRMKNFLPLHQRFIQKHGLVPGLAKKA